MKFSAPMAKLSPVSIFLAATSLAIASGTVEPAHAQSPGGGLKEWSTDQTVDEKSIPDADAEAMMKKAEEEDICVPVGEGENCW